MTGKKRKVFIDIIGPQGSCCGITGGVKKKKKRKKEKEEYFKDDNRLSIGL